MDQDWGGGGGSKKGPTTSSRRLFPSQHVPAVSNGKRPVSNVFTHQGESAGAYCNGLTPDDFARQRENAGAERNLSL
jgi:hypothetical protein